MANPKSTEKAQTTALTTAGAPPPGSLILKEYETPDISKFNDWSVEQTGFAPYFEPEPGAFFVAYIRKADLKDPNFLRYLFQASSMIVRCRRGAKPEGADEKPELDTRPIVDVAPGQYFSLGLFFSMVENLNTYLLYQYETKENVEVLIRFVNKVKTGNKRTVWNVDMRLKPELQRKMDAFRVKQMQGGSDEEVPPALPPVPVGGEERANN